MNKYKVRFSKSNIVILSKLLEYYDVWDSYLSYNFDVMRDKFKKQYCIRNLGQMIMATIKIERFIYCTKVVINEYT